MNSSHSIDASVKKFIHGGQALGELEDGRKALLWNALPGEKVSFSPSKSKSSYVEGIAETILSASEDRVEPRDQLYLSTSPWQILRESKEDFYKQEVLRETFERAGLEAGEISFHHTDSFWHYRNKMEYSFFGDDDGLHLALYNRGSHLKQIVTGSSIAMPIIDEVATAIVAVLDEASVRASSLKSLIIRANQAGEAVVAIFTRDQDFPELQKLSELAKGVVVVYSNPKSPASVRTRDLYTFGDVNLVDNLLGNEIGYDVFSFFQVNIPIFEAALNRIKDFCGDDVVVDFYSGVGSIGLSLPSTTALVESDHANILHAQKNILNKRSSTEAIEAFGERALDFIPREGCLIVDPPRAGLHSAVVDRILEVAPPKIAYLSCNPSTQARDVALLAIQYDIDFVEGFNFFPRTPHIESLVMLRLRK